MRPETYDYIVIGSGSSGGVVASRLSESGEYKVLCLEAGDRGERYFWSVPPAGAAFMIDNPAVNWRYASKPNETHGNRPIYIPRGKILGGSSALNGTVYNRGQQLDYDTWAQMGCRGWSFDDVLPFLKKLESTDVGSDEYRGRSGPVKVTEVKKNTPFFDIFIKAAKAVGIPENPDYGGATQEGVAMAQQTVYRGRRQSTATQYLAPARKRPNLTILSGSEATSLILEGKRCVGVRFERDGGPSEASATREVIVACGTANSPKLLELSGIGNPEILHRHGIPVVHELKGVGENLRDHFTVFLKWRFNRPGLSLAPQGRGFGLLREIIRYALTGGSFIGQGYGTLRVFVRSRPELETPDIMMAVSPFLMEPVGGQRSTMSPVEGFHASSYPQRTESTGTVHIQSADPFAPPVLDFRFHDTENDRRTAIIAVRRAREIAAASPLAEVIAEELAPGPAAQTDDQILDYIRANSSSAQHMVGTCKMGVDAMAVVDERLRVHGMTGLRVADASIMPTIISGNTSVPCMMIGEKCADMVLADVR